MDSQSEAGREARRDRAGPVATKSRRRRGRRAYVIFVLLVILLNLVSFGPAIIDPSTRTVPLPLTSLVLVHTIVSVAWLFVVLVQVTLVATGRSAVHRRLGVIAVLLTAAFIVLAWFATVEEARRGFDLSGDLVPRGTSADPATILAPVNTLLLLAILIGAAVWYRHRPAVHKRLMMLAILGLSTGAPIAHLIGHWPLLQRHAGIIGPGSAVILLSVLAIHDRMSQGRIHPVSLWGGVGVFAWLVLFFVVIAPTSAWRDFAMWVVQ